MKVAVIISTHGTPAWLQKTLWGYECQTYNNFEVIIAEGGTCEETRALINGFGQKSGMNIRHISEGGNEDQEAHILNRAIASTNSDYLIFSNDHCIPRNDFVEVHMKRSRKHHFLAGGYFSVPMKVSKAITREDIGTLFAFDWRWLFDHGLQPAKWIGMTNQRLLDKLFERFSSAPPPWCGFNSSAWREDILSVNGFNEDLTRGDYDWDFGERLVRRGVAGIHVRNDAICLCLERVRELTRDPDESARRADRNRIKLQTGAWAVNGISKSGTTGVKERHSAA